MEKRIREAIASHDIPLLRAMLVERITNAPGRTSTLEMVRRVMEEVPDLFDEEEDYFYTLPREEWNEAYTETLRRGLKKRFTPDRLEIYVEVEAYLYAHPEARYPKPEERTIPSDTPEIAIEGSESTIAASDDAEYVSTPEIAIELIYEDDEEE